MSEGQEQQKRNRRRRGRRGGRGGGSQSGDAPGASSAGDTAGSPPGPPGPPGPGGQDSHVFRAPDAAAPRSDARGPRRDTRGQPRQDRFERPETGARTHRAPASGGDRRPDRGPRGDRGGFGRSAGPRDRDRDNRVFEPPVPQDEASIELGAKFKEAQVALRDARKALDKRKAEFGDEPDWMLEQFREAELAFETAATAWHEHLGTTGRKVVRR